MKDKKFFKIIVAWLFLLIPTYLIIYNMTVIFSDKLTVENVTKVVATGANDTDYETTDRNDIKLYVQMIKNAIAMDEAASTLEFEFPFALTFYKGEKEIVYELSLSQNVDDCIIRSSDRKIYFLKGNDAKKLLSTPLADSLYDYSNVPSIQLIYDDRSDIIEANPSEGIWYLKRADDIFEESNVQNVFTESTNIQVTRGKFLELKFTLTPDTLNISVYADKQLIYNKPYLDFVNEFTYDTHTKLQYVVKAEWLKNDFNSYYGEGTYTFDVNYTVPPTFEISKFDADPGEILTVTALNMKDTDFPTLTTDMGFKPSFVKVGGKLVAFLPIGTESMGKNFTAEVSGSSSVEDTSYQLYVNQKTYNSAKYSAQDTAYTAHKSKTARESKESSYASIFASNSPDTVYWADDPQFIMPHQGDVKVGYGWSVTTNGVAETNKGMNINTSKGDPVIASNAGQVVFAGTVPDDGNLVVIDHGGGVRSWYGHLNEVYVVNGDIVTKSQEIGTAGTSGFYSTLHENLYFAVSVYTVFVDPIYVTENGIMPN